MASGTPKKKAAAAAPKMARGVDLRPNAYRFRHRIDVTEDGRTKKKTVNFVNYPFLDEAACRAAGLPNDDPRWPSNALAQANEYSRVYWRDLNLPQPEERPIKGTLREWLERYRDEDLHGHLYGDPAKPAPFAQAERSDNGRTHDAGQIDTLMRMGGFVVPGEEERRRTNPRAAKMLDKNRPLFYPEVRDVLNTEVSRLGKSHCRVLLDRWAGGKGAPSTKRRFRTNLMACMVYHRDHYDMASSEEWLKVPISDDGRKPAARALTTSEWRTIETQLNEMNLHPHTRACLLFIRWTGLRRGEACKMRWENISWPKVRGAVPTVRLERTKARRGVYRERVVPIPEAAESALRALVTDANGQIRPWPKSGWVFPAPQDPSAHIAGTTVYQGFISVFGTRGRKGMSIRDSRIGVPRAAPHHLRHTAATEMSVYISEQQMMELFGWTDPEMLNRYRHQAEHLGLLVRDAHNNLRSAAEMKKAEDMVDFFKGMSEADRERIMARMAVVMAEEAAAKIQQRKGPSAKAPKSRKT
ncbi:tyrosine-type recombinase/integrase [Dyella psychrodurans]|nr:tyrosine-type recombinase/integrase [Dyella psychrodurans]